MRRRASRGKGQSIQGRRLLPQVRAVFTALYATQAGPCLLAWAMQTERSPAVPVALVVLLAAAWYRMRTATAPLLLDVVSAAALACVIVWGVGIEPSYGLIFVGAIHRALYGRWGGLAVSAALQVAVLVGSALAVGTQVALAEVASDVPGLVCVTGAFHLLATALHRYETGQESRFQALVRSSSDVILVTDADTAVTYASPALGRIFGPAPGGPPAAPAGGGASGVSDDDAHAELAGRPPRLLDWVVPEDRGRVAASIEALVAAGTDAGVTTVTCRVLDGRGRLRHVEMTVQNALATRGVRGLIVNAHDVTARVDLAEQLSSQADQLRHQALHDPLTGLANRVLFADRLELALSQRDGTAALMLVDLDGFKAVNDTHGHAAGDELLVQVAERMLACLRPQDTVARLGGDEFAVLIGGGDLDEALVLATAERLLVAIATPAVLSSGTVRPGASIGVALGGPPAGDAEGRRAPQAAAEHLQRCADLAMYQAKATGKNRVEVYREQLHASATDRASLAADLAGALEGRQLHLHYQPIVALRSGRLVGVEALLRWEHPVRGIVLAAELVPVAEAARLIQPIGAWALLEACRRVASWQRLHPREEPLRLSVNLSVRQLEDPGAASVVATALEASGLAPGTLTVDVPEDVLVSEVAGVHARLREIRDLGVRISVDDFGTGRSALSHLLHHPVDELKVDRSAVEQLGAGGPGRDPAALTCAILAMGRALGLSTVAEGIETPAQLAHLTELGCELGQGTHLSSPLDERALEALLVGGRVRPLLATAAEAGALAPAGTAPSGHRAGGPPVP
ncbi:bifunctional diguanylate cyclase/phosphodiesterase [Quadrisphaera sp. DSM 44207]|uniref:putative bifunctional diguanylate cyclase/phosphodiesterase n=1 Tax=Quadrisphaera sp. DSM 44207 TaxID=1881057 RepID=UPI0008803D3C|nr:GGDEF domain-containing phosphodiesterase [Quadrisphaera sp. DSM 44207]SDQ70178.1 diguanylate cyclase (GGDEF) domain-containing protein [Quadrisphaera sp. DSM 44207]